MVSYGLLSSPTVSYVLVWSLMVSYGLISPLMFSYSLLWSLMVPLWSLMFSYGLLSSPMVSYVLVWSLMVSYGLISPLMFSYGLLWSLMVPLWSRMVPLWSHMVPLWSLMHFFQWINTIRSLIYYITVYVSCYICKNHRHDNKTQCRAHTSLWPSPGPYITVSWAVPGLALVATAAGISQDDSAAL